MKKLVLSVLLLSSFLQQLYSESLVNLDTINNRVIKLFKQENYSDCYNLAKDLYSLSKDANDTILVFNSLYYMGFSNQRMGNMEKAIDYNMRAYEVSQSLQRLDLQSSILNNIGNVYMVNDEDSVAAVYFEKSIEISDGISLTDTACSFHCKVVPSQPANFCDEKGRNGCNRLAMLAIK